MSVRPPVPGPLVRNVLSVAFGSQVLGEECSHLGTKEVKRSSLLHIEIRDAAWDL